MKKIAYITTTLPYVNAEPHIGFAMEIVRADALARYYKLSGKEVFFNTGTDEHGQKIFDAATKAGVAPQAYVDGLAERFRELGPLLSISPEVHFIRTSEERHKRCAEEFWRRCDSAGYIYKKHYSTKYCVGCELEKTDSELVDGRCPIHPKMEIELREEENYFFKFSAFADRLKAFYESRPDFVVPEFRYREIKAFVERGLEDFSISRLKSKMSWGVPVPNDPDHVMYVWFDALTSYISTLGWPEEGKGSLFEKFWVEGEPTQYCGKDNLRQQSAMWQAMLMAAGLPQSRRIIINGFITGEGGVKMSKSLGNVVAPTDVVKAYGTDALRYFLLAELQSFEDSPFSDKLMKDAYNAKLANGIGNLASRTLKMATSYNAFPELVSRETMRTNSDFVRSAWSHFEHFDTAKVAAAINAEVLRLDQFIQVNQPFKEIKINKEKAERDVMALVEHLYALAIALEPLLPITANKLLAAIESKTMPEALFMRKE